METASTKINGATATYALRGEIAGIHCKIAVTKKYMFAYRLNYRSKLIGKNDISEYLDVLMKFVGNSVNIFIEVFVCASY